MPYAINDTLSKKPIDGGIEITDAEYKAAMDAKLQGRKAYVHDGSLLVESETQRTVYSTTDGSEKQIADNAPLPDGYTETERPGKYYDWDGVQWVVDVSKVADAKVAELKAACRGAIFAGFDSSALGTAHRYPLSQTDQANLQKNETAATRNLSTTGWECYCQCIDANGVQDYRPHTASQMIQVADDIQDGKEALLYGTLRPKIGQVRTIEADDALTDEEKRAQINAITW